MRGENEEKRPYDERDSWYFQNPKDGTEMVRVPGGWFWMGSEDGDKDACRDEKPRHRHYVEPYWIGLECVTVEQFGRFVKEPGHDEGSDWKNDPLDHPVRYVNWFDAEAYTKWAGLRLPSEAEWELAARGYEGRRYSWGDDWENGQRVCWDKQNGPKGSTEPVYSHPEGVGPFGTFQQSGNLWEWCADWYDDEAYQRYAKGDFSPQASGSSRVLRGGSWNFDLPKLFRGACRYNVAPENRNFNCGFRLARKVTL